MISIPGYKIIKPIGQGGMATVYLALQESVGRNVAIKVMSPSLSNDPSFSERFIKEARMASLIHPHIITVFDASESAGQNYIVMEYASAGNLDSVIKKGISVSRTVEIIIQIASALNYSAKKGFIHRDVKPENILFREDGSAILVDFGIAKAITAGTRLTMVGSTIGSPNYMSPEQARGLDLDGRSDLYSLGIVFFEALTGVKPFDASDTFVIGMKHINDPIPQLPEAYKIFQPIIDKLLAKDATDRFDNGQMLINALAKIDITEAEANAAKTQSATAEDKTRFSKSIREQETKIVTADDATRVSPHTLATNDKTRVAPSDDATVVSPQKSVGNKSSTTLVLSVIILILAAGGGYFWFSTQQQPKFPQTPEITQTPVEIVEKPEPQEPTEPEPVTVSKPEPVVQPIIKIKPEPVTPSVDDQIATLLIHAQQAVAAKRYTTPENNNAHYYYLEVLSLDKMNKTAQQGIVDLSNKYLTIAESQFERNKLSTALSTIEKGLFVNSDNQSLIVLKGKILNRQKADTVKPTQPAIVAIPTHESIIATDESLLDVVGIHVGADSRKVKWHAQQDFVNLLYNKILQQCNNSNNLLNHADCLNTYQRFLKQWPLPLLATSYDQSGEQGVEIKGQVKFKKQEVRTSYQKALDEYKIRFQQAIANQFHSSADIISLANYTLFTPLISAFGLDTTAKLDDTLAQATENRRKLNPLITDRNALLKQLKTFMKADVHIRPFVTHNSFEITPFANSLYHLLKSKFGDVDKYRANYTLQGEYQINQDGSINLNLWLFNAHGEISYLEPLKLSKSVTQDTRYTTMFYNESFMPENHLEKSYGFASEISIAEQSANALLITGQEVSLKVKLDHSGFYFIAVHVMRKNEQYSYLLPLHIAEVPFVQVATRSATNQFVELGSFKVTPPLGVEALQLVSSSVNLEKYLPNYHWDDKRQQFVVDGSEGNISAGIKKVRSMANQISANSQGNGIRWQERFLVTTILDKP